MKCACCDIELSSNPLLVDGKPFCCHGCAEGGPCTCTYEGDQGRYPRNGHHKELLLPDLLAEGP